LKTPPKKFSGAICKRQSLRLSSKCEDHFFNSIIIYNVVSNIFYSFSSFPLLFLLNLKDCQCSILQQNVIKNGFMWCLLYNQ